MPLVGLRHHRHARHPASAYLFLQMSKQPAAIESSFRSLGKLHAQPSATAPGDPAAPTRRIAMRLAAAISKAGDLPSAGTASPSIADHGTRFGLPRLGRRPARDRPKEELAAVHSENVKARCSDHGTEVLPGTIKTRQAGPGNISCSRFRGTSLLHRRQHYCACSQARLAAYPETPWWLLASRAAMASLIRLRP